jgi:phage terminase large subunit
MTRRMLAFKKRIPIYRKSPETFFKEILNFNPDKWQEEVSDDIAIHRFVSVRSGQGVGKTALEAAIAYGSSVVSHSRVLYVQLLRGSS